jgi:hypothetical protein
MEANGSITFDDLTRTGAIGGDIDDDGVPDSASDGQTDETSTNAAVSNMECFNLLLPVELIGFKGEQIGYKNVLDCKPPARSIVHISKSTVLLTVWITRCLGH